MRWLVGILVLANLSLFLWKSGDEIQATRHTEPPPTVPGVASLTLLSELPEGEPAEAKAAAETPPVTEQTVVAGGEEEASQAAAAETQPPGAQSEEAASAAEPREEESTPAEEAAAESPAAIAEAPPPEPFCVRLGPFREEQPARSAIADLAASGVFATFVQEGESSPTRYIVYLPPAPSRKAALETLRELRRKKIDSFVFSSGELKNGISLGIFGQQGSAERLLKEMEGKGYRPRMLTRQGEQPRYWLTLGPKNAAKLSEELQAALQERYPEAGYNREACP
ncbi:MAG: hypothetical protein Kow006_11230 [Gammaproteobacteria bacterium]